MSGLALGDLFAGTPWRVERALNLAVRNPLRDVAIISRETGARATVGGRAISSSQQSRVNTTMVRIAVLSLGLLTPAIAHAYIGPGAGITALGSLLALVGAVLLALVGLVWYPLKRLLRARRKAAPAATDTDTPGSP